VRLAEGSLCDHRASSALSATLPDAAPRARVERHAVCLDLRSAGHVQGVERSEGRGAAEEPAPRQLGVARPEHLSPLLP